MSCQHYHVEYFYYHQDLYQQRTSIQPVPQNTIHHDYLWKSQEYYHPHVLYSRSWHQPHQHHDNSNDQIINRAKCNLPLMKVETNDNISHQYSKAASHKHMRGILYQCLKAQIEYRVEEQEGDHKKHNHPPK